MGAIQTIPNQDVINLKKKLLPSYMYPTGQPAAVMFVGFLSDDECDAIIEHGEQITPYKTKGCRAVTREYPAPPRLLPAELHYISQVGLYANEVYWGFDIRRTSTSAWLQTYDPPGDYHIHTDAAIGQSRKLTAVALLTDPSKYEGADLQLHNWQGKPDVIDRTRGTVVVFPGWTVHEVTEITWGHRQTINMGWWGPPFK